MQKVIYLIVLVAFISGCVEIAAKKQIAFINYNSFSYPPHQKDCPIDLFFQGNPQRPYEVIGEIMGQLYHDRNLRLLLETRARQVGADAVIDIQTSMGVVTESGVTQQSVRDTNGNVVGTMPVAETSSERVINVRAKVIKYKQ